MLTLTNAARTRLSEKLADYPEHIAGRIVRRDGRLKLRSSRRLPGDATIENDGRILLLMDDQMAKQLANKRLVVRDTQNGLKMKFQTAQ